MPMRVLSLFLALAVAAGCGFHLRGSRSVDLGAARPYVSSSGAEELAAELRRLLVASRVGLAGRAADADLIVELGEERFDRRVLSVDADTGKVREVEIGYEALLDVRRPDGTVLVERERIELERDFVFDETAVLGTFEQQTLIEQEIRADVAQTLLRRLEALELE